MSFDKTKWEHSRGCVDWFWVPFWPLRSGYSQSTVFPDRSVVSPKTPDIFDVFATYFLLIPKNLLEGCFCRKNEKQGTNKITFQESVLAHHMSPVGKRDRNTWQKMPCIRKWNNYLLSASILLRLLGPTRRIFATKSRFYWPRISFINTGLKKSADDKEISVELIFSFPVRHCGQQESSGNTTAWQPETSGHLIKLQRMEPSLLSSEPE